MTSSIEIPNERKKGDYLQEDLTLEQVFPGRFQKKRVVCQTKPLRMCIHDYRGDLSKCIKEVAIFEATCSRSIQYWHDKEGLDENAQTAFIGRSEFQSR